MKGVLGLARELLDHMGSPAASPSEAEGAAVRFAAMLSRDTDLGAQLARIELGSEDTDLLSLPAWLWYLGWRRDHGGERPSDAFFSALFDRSPDHVARLRILEEAVLSSSSARDETRREVRWLEQLPDSWLRDRLRGLTHSTDARNTEGERPEEKYGEAFQMAILLLQIGHPLALDALRAFLSEEWDHAERLRREMTEVVRSAVGEDRHWLTRLGLE